MRVREAAGSRRRWSRQALAVAAACGLVAAMLVGAQAAPPPASAAGPARDGSSAETAAPSCWSVKQSYPASGDGIYWLRTPTLVAPEQFYCDMTTDGGGWVLIGRGREGWSFPYWGQGSPSTVRNTINGPAAFAPATLSTPTVDGLMDGGRMDALTDGIRVRRAADQAGTRWQEVRMRVQSYGRWSWAFGGGIPLSSITFDGTTYSLSDSSYRTNTTADTRISNDTRRSFTYPVAIHNNQAGFSYGYGVRDGANNATSYLWEYADENNAIPFAQVFIRPRITEADITAGGVSFAPDGGLPESTVRPMLDRRPVPQPWGTTGIDDGDAIPSLNANVTAFAQIGNVIYIGGKFLAVQRGPGGPTYPQSYLAAFDKDTGEWIPGFAPVLDAPVWKLKAAPDGSKLFVAGEFTSVNGQAATSALAALDPATGAPTPSWVGYAWRSTGSYDVRALDIQDGWLYAGGNFTRIAGGVGSQLLGPVTDSRLARFRLSDGRPDGTWKPMLGSAPQDIDASARGDRVYAVGLFSTLNGETLDPTRLAIVDTTTGVAVPGLEPFQPNSTAKEWQNAILEVGDKVYQGGSQHFLHQYNRSDYAFERSVMTKVGGDYQAIAYDDGIVYASCHCGNWQYQDSNSWPNPVGYSRVEPINYIGAYDTKNNLEMLPEFQPTQLDITGADGEGPWELFFDSNRCMWAGGDLVRQDGAANPFYGGYERFCARDAQAPAVPSNASASVSGNSVTLSWGASTDNGSGPVRYEVLKDDPTFGTIVMDSTFGRTLTDTGVTGTTRYFVRAVDAEGNRSATTSVIQVTPPPPPAATLLASGATWSYRADGQDLGEAWRQPGYDLSSWPSGPSELGWGDGDETTAIGGGPITHYFVREIDIPEPGLYETVTVRLKRDDAAVVYVNGVEVVRDNLPSGEVTATTLASSYTSGAQETTWYEYQIPASLFTTGENTLAVELHQADASNADGSFDLELVARMSTESNPPSTPTVSATPGFNTVALAWPPATDDVAVAGYLVRRDGVPVAFTRGTAFVDTGLVPSTPYGYEVIAVDSSGNTSAPGGASTTTTPNPTLVAPGSVWSYQSGGNPPAEWREPGFDVSSWPSGPAQLGWGDGDEATVVPSGTITQYYVRTFTVEDPTSFQVLRLRLRRDDAAAVYLNGSEVVRDNLPVGPLTPATWSVGGTWGAAESTWYEFPVPGSLLVPGENVIAVEVHQNTSNNADSTFDLELAAATPTEASPPTRPAPALTAATGTSISLGWAPATDDTGVLGYLVYRDGAPVGFTTQTSFTDTGLTPDTVYGYRVEAIDTSGNPSTPGVVAAATTPDPLLVDFGAAWRYRFDGVDQASAWREPGFDDSTWASGPSELGIGDGDEATVIGPTTTPTPITAYFRRTFEVSNPSVVTGLALDVIRDDGFVVYVNGVEVARDNMPAGPVSYSTRPSAGIDTRAGETTPVTLSIPPSALQPGTNTIAVEMHQSNTWSRDLSFSLRLQASYAGAPAPALTLTEPIDGSALATSAVTFSGLCTTTAGAVTVEVTGTQPATLTAPCTDNEWAVDEALPDGSYTATAAQTDSGGLTGTSRPASFTVDAP